MHKRITPGEELRDPDPDEGYRSMRRLRKKSQLTP